MSAIRFIGTMAVASLFVTGIQAAPTVVAASSESVSYSLAPGTCRVITIPLINKPVHLIGAGSQLADEGAGEFTLISTSNVLSWVGVDLNTGAVHAGKSATLGDHIMWLDGAGYVDVQVRTRRAIQICNRIDSGLNPTTGTVTFLW